MKTLIPGHQRHGSPRWRRRWNAQRSAPVLHLDAVHFLPGWKERPLEQEREMVTCFLDENPSWVMDGNYTKTCMARRLAEADQILVLYFGRSYLFISGGAPMAAKPGPGALPLRRAAKKLDLEFICWVALAGPQPCLSCPAGLDRPDLPG